jgi:hypothetical protein
MNKFVQGNFKIIFQSYEGLIKNSLMHGRGLYNWPNGDKYIGEYSDGLRTGNGVMNYYAKGEKYQGKWLDGLYHGQGEYRLW